MRGRVDQQENMWFTQRSEDFVPETHPLRGIKKLADAELARLSPVFNKAYAKSGRRYSSRAPDQGDAVASAVFDSLRATALRADLPVVPGSQT